MSWNPELTPVPKFNPDFAHVPELRPELTSTPEYSPIKAPESAPESAPELNREPTQVSDPPKPSTTSMGEMTTADVSNQPPAVEDPKCSHTTQPKAGLPDTPKATGSVTGPPSMPQQYLHYLIKLNGHYL
ncbi:hypothetical protein G5714_016456 [Onychostoma macrolepis]|uniref:Uncharacterized protein n=1 Tax=Onychostoma macrolepis TaxID=369639 RepID=A0A7J6CA82_9TELE|nr:hypothetical protein G5714_016456 [Onychostoma macrolepis]